MDLQKLIESQAKLAARTPSTPGAPKAGADAINRPIDLQQAQADRVKDRIEGLEKSKAALIESIDAELQELKSEHQARTRKVETERKNIETAMKAASAASAARPRKPLKTAMKAASAASAARPRKSLKAPTKATAAAPKGKKTPRVSSTRKSKPR